MLLYRTQPKNSTQNSIIHSLTKKELMSDLGLISRFKNKKLVQADLIPLVTDASIIDGLITCGGYSNILVVTSFEDKHYDRIRDRNYRPVNSAGDHLLPIVHSKNESFGNMYVTMPRNADNYMKPLYDAYGINQIPTDSYFRLDGEFKIKTDVEFDCVVLLGCESYKKGKFKLSDIKKKFAKYCIQNFDLIDVHRNLESDRTIIGNEQDVSNHIERMIQCVNTPTKIYDQRRRVAKHMDNHRHQLYHFRLALNLEKYQEYYKVY